MAGEAFADHLDDVRGLSGKAAGGDRVAIHRGRVERRQVNGCRDVGDSDAIESICDGHRFAALNRSDRSEQFPEGVVNV